MSAHRAGTLVYRATGASATVSGAPGTLFISSHHYQFSNPGRTRIVWAKEDSLRTIPCDLSRFRPRITSGQGEQQKCLAGEFVLHLPPESLGGSEEWPNGPVRVRAEILCSPELPLGGDGSNDQSAVDTPWPRQHPSRQGLFSTVMDRS